MDMDIFAELESEVRGYCRAYPTVFESASNARQVDEAGKSYIDFFAGAGVLNFGHNNPRMKKAIIAYIESDGVAHSLDTHTTAKRTFLEKFNIIILKPRGMTYKFQFMGPTGTNAVETALKLARRVTGRSSVIAFSHGFHGMTLGALSLTANEYFRNAAGVPLEHVMRLPFETAPGGGLQAIEDYRAAFRDGSSGLPPPAAIMVETIQAEGGVNVASRDWLHALQNLARETGALFIIDDIQASCGRTGSYFSFDGMDLDPDIICLAKGIGGFGTPMAMNLNKPEHDKMWSPGEHTGTFRGQGLSFVAGREALRYFEDDSLMQDVRRMGQNIRDRLEAIAAKYASRGWDVRGRGMMQGIDLVDGALAKAVAAECFQSGLLVGPCGTGGRVIKLIPPLTIPEADLETGLTILENTIDKVMEAS
ncbi:diaminobutyrate--2-oxoglutarate transaminase [Paremcibacter congregatus]|uniref:Diaminobutyrate--2-oxoglutarate transaminase n=2 Tax=Paremcibacter congregatus TaxID=2043170 RepID=A0A2G4YSD8_9PROT|nr:aspartate aminotransferase family protein [Paremcibacter congregatus]PHZ85213.1 diaminobutyrate--2-oxoglutarate transaminase [Paremcibacter congregatus]QDE27854.1 aspartate aminotransferase family protein [Paremcibacter congregatus]